MKKPGTETSAEAKAKTLNPFERYLTLWVALCMAAGVLSRVVLIRARGRA